MLQALFGAEGKRRRGGVALSTESSALRAFPTLRPSETPSTQLLYN